MKRRTDHYASYKDPSAKVFWYEDEEKYIFRELAPSYLQHYQHFKSMGLAAELIKKNWLITFEEVEQQVSKNIILKARKISFVSYPYEWTFNQWKNAALLTLKIQNQALKFGMTLKDASPFNIVFEGTKPVFIDISSFEIFKEGEPWQAYKQFSENFYMPLLLVKYFGNTGNDIYLNNCNGISLSKGLLLLPATAHFNFNTLFYLTLPDKIRQRLKAPGKPLKNTGIFTKKRSMQFAEQLFSTIEKVKPVKKITQWNTYYDTGKIDAGYLEEKQIIIKEWFANNYTEKTLIDFGCNTGNFSKLLSPYLNKIIAFDEDINCVDDLYNFCHKQKVNNIFPFCANITHPTPAVGFNNLERTALKERLKGDTGIALAIIHHLVFNNNLNFEMIAGMFASACNELVIEFVPKEDAKVQLLLANREDIFDWYTPENFISEFEKKFILFKTHRLTNDRLLVHFIPKINEQ